MKSILAGFAGLVAGLVVTASAAPASAAGHWELQKIGGNPICAVAIAGRYALGCARMANGNYPIWEKNPNTHVWGATNGGAVSITTGATSDELAWAVSVNNTIWWRETGAWVQFPNNKCEGGGGSFTIKKVLGDHTIAAGLDQDTQLETLFVVDGTHPYNLRWWNGSCWWKMPAVPSGVTREVGIFYDETDFSISFAAPWVVTPGGFLFRWDWENSVWIPITTGSAQGIASGWFSNSVVGQDNTSLWWYDQESNSFGRNNSWNLGTIVDLGAGTALISESVLRSDGRVYHWAW